MTAGTGPDVSITALDGSARARALHAFGRTHRGRRALLVVVYDGSGGHLVADLPLTAVVDDGDEVRILLGGPEAGLARSHAVWDVEATRIVRADGRDVALRLEYTGGRTVLLLPRPG